MIETWLARTFIVIIASLMLFIAGAGCSIFLEYRKRFRAGKDESFNSHGWTALIVTATLELMLGAAVDIGQAFLLVTEGWGGLVALAGTLLLPIMGYKSVQTITAGKNQPTTINGGGGV